MAAMALPAVLLFNRLSQCCAACLAAMGLIGAHMWVPVAALRDQLSFSPFVLFHPGAGGLLCADFLSLTLISAFLISG